MNVYSIGTRAVQTLLFREVYLEEKIDGRQIVFGRLQQKPEEDPVLEVKGRVNETTEQYLQSIEFSLKVGYLYVGEYLEEPQGRVLAYERTPNNNIMITDVVNTENGTLLSHEEKFMEAESLGLECVPLLYQGPITNAEQLKGFLEQTSALGGERIEGVIIKPVKPVLDKRSKTPIYAKFVNPDYLLRRQFSVQAMEAMMMAELQGGQHDEGRR